MDFLFTMKTFTPRLNPWVIVVVSCLAWIGAITLVLVRFLELSGTAGWAIGGILGATTAAGISVILFELRRAIEMPGHADLPKHFSER